MLRWDFIPGKRTPERAIQRLSGFEWLFLFYPHAGRMPKHQTQQIDNCIGNAHQSRKCENFIPLLSYRMSALSQRSAKQLEELYSHANDSTANARSNSPVYVTIANRNSSRSPIRRARVEPASQTSINMSGPVGNLFRTLQFLSRLPNRAASRGTVCKQIQNDSETRVLARVALVELGARFHDHGDTLTA